MKITPHWTITEPPKKKANCRKTRIQNEDARREIKSLLETMETGNSFTVEGARAHVISSMISQLKDNWGIDINTTVRTIEGVVKVWIV